MPTRNSVVQVGESTWRLGHTIRCDRITTPPDLDDPSIASWKDGNYWYTLRPTTSEQPVNDTPIKDSSDVHLFHEGGTLSAVWAIGNNAFCKVKHWCPNMPSESETIKFVQRVAPQVPVAEVIHSWLETNHNRSFLVLKRVSGMTLRDAWGAMSAEQRDSVLEEVVQICDTLASVTSERLENVTGGPVYEPYLAHSDKGLLEALTVKECQEYFFREDLLNPEFEQRFHLYHPDLGPGNIIIAPGTSTIAGIIDWESAGFYPRFWISTNPSVSHGMNFHPPIPDVEDHEWRKRLRTRLEERGYPRFAEWYMKWFRTKSRRVE